MHVDIEEAKAAVAALGVTEINARQTGQMLCISGRFDGSIHFAQADSGKGETWLDAVRQLKALING